ncbi:MAG: hypothetical protein HZB53_20370 [Chloroflexi bacterium]|nr:hypothetical protein [Chloroflexota bacterium]
MTKKPLDLSGFPLFTEVEADLKEATLALIALRDERVQPTRAARVCRDPANDQLLEAPVAGRAACSVSTENEVLRLYEFECIRVTTPRALLQMLSRQLDHETHESTRKARKGVPSFVAFELFRGSRVPNVLLGFGSWDFRPQGGCVMIHDWRAPLHGAHILIACLI